MKKVLNNKRLNKLLSLLLIVAVLCTTLFGNVMDASAYGGPPTPPPEFNVSVDNPELNVGETTNIKVANAPWGWAERGIDYSSSNDSMASISGTTVTAKSEGTVTITATAWKKIWVSVGWGGYYEKQTEDTAECEVKINAVEVPITEVTMEPSSINLKNGVSSNLVATVLPANTTYDNAVNWSSSDDGVATVVNGVVTAKKTGTATITATAISDITKTATCTVTVANPVESVSISKTSTSIEKGKSELITATINPNDADDTTVIWTSSEEDIATVNGGTITAVSEGSAIIYATSSGDQSKIASCEVTVTAPIVSVTGLSVLENVTIAKDSSKILTATVLPADATNQQVKWSTSDSDKVTVDQTSGTITGKKIGTAKITATTVDGSFTQTCLVTVVNKVNNVKISQYKNSQWKSSIALSLNKNNESTLYSKVEPNNADKSVVWTSSDPNVVTVDASGKIKAIASGTAIITVASAIDSSQTATCTVTVNKMYYNHIDISTENATIGLDNKDLSVYISSITSCKVTNTDGSIDTYNGNEFKKEVNEYRFIKTISADITQVEFVVNLKSITDPSINFSGYTMKFDEADITAAKNRCPGTGTGKGIDFLLKGELIEEESEYRYTVIYTDEKAAVQTISQSVVSQINDTITLPEPAFNSTLFQGWYINGDTSGTAYAPGVTYTVIADVTFVAIYTTPAVTDTNFYVLKVGYDYPGKNGADGRVENVSGNSIGNSSANYSSVGEGKFSYTFTPDKSFAENYTSDGYDTTKVEGVLLTTPTLEDISKITETKGGYFYQATAVDWYVVKSVNNSWHVDGIATWSKKAIEYKIDYKVSVSGNEFVLIDSENRTVEADKELKSEDKIDFSSLKFSQENSYFDGWYSDEACTQPISKILTSEESDVTVYGKWIEKTSLTLTAKSGTSIYSGEIQNYSSDTFDGIPVGLTIEGLTTIASGKDAGLYTTTTDKSLVKVMQGDENVAEKYMVTVNEATFTIEKAVVTISANNSSRAYGEENPEFELSFTGIVQNDINSHTITDFTATTIATSSSKVGDYPIVPSLKDDLISHDYENYTIDPVNGVLTVRKAVANELKVENRTVEYNGTNQSVYEATSAIKGSKIEYQYTDENGIGIGKWTKKLPSFKDAGTYKVLVRATKDNYETDQTFEILTITKAPMIVTANDVEVPYMQVPKLTVKVDGILKADKKHLTEYDFKVSILGNNYNPGTYVEVIVPSLKRNVADNYGNYNITYVNGDLKIVKASGLYNVIRSKDIYTTFDNKAHSAYAASAKFGSTISYSTDIGFNKHWSKEVPTFTQAGAYLVFIKATHIGYENSYSSEWLVINKAKQWVTFDSKEVTFEEGTLQSLEAASTTAINTKFRKTSIQYSVDLTKWSNTMPTFTNEGTYKIFVRVRNENYKEVTKSAILTILPSDANGISANNVEVTYNGKEHSFAAQGTVSGSTVYYNTEGNEEDFDEEAWTTEAPSFTNAGSYPVAVRVEKQNYVTKEGNYTVTIIPAKVIITIDDKSKIIDSSDPTFTGSKVVTNAADFDAGKFNTEFGTVTYGRIAAHQYWNTAGDNVKLTAYYSPNANYVVTVLGGTLRINAKPEAPTPPPAPTPVNPVVVTPPPVVPAQVTTITVTPVVRRTTRNAAAQVVETPEVEEAEEVEDVIIEDEPVAEEAEPVISEEKEDADSALTAIEDEETAKAVLESDCWIHWLILLLTALYSVYAIVRAYIRNKRIKELEDDAEEVNA